MRRPVDLGRLYAITPDRSPREIEQLVDAWLAAGVRAIQLRHTGLGRAERFELATRLVARAHGASATLIVNDELDIALAAGADGVHLGPDDLTVAAARRAGGTEILIGASAATPEAARQAESEGADYLGSGPAFASTNKTTKPVIGPAGIAAVAAAVSIPVFAIGGITPERVGQLRASGIERVAVIAALAGGDPAGAATAFLGALS
ncbi:MAG TPA: thiamine phosphate synthase [Candidatus Dormibacteraeota bacterium]